MSRTRQLHPEFFHHEDLGELSPLHRLLFQGMWCEADRMGRLEDRPRRLKATYLPYDNADGEQIVADLAERGLALRYQDSSGRRLLWIPGFKRQQKVHPNEEPSVFDRHPDDSNPEEEPPPSKSRPKRAEHQGSPKDHQGAPRGSPGDASGTTDGTPKTPLSSLSSQSSCSTSASQKAAATAAPEPLKLDAPPSAVAPASKPRGPSAQERIWGNLQVLRAEVVPNAPPDHGVGRGRLGSRVAALNAALGELCDPGHFGSEAALVEAYRAFLRDPWARGCSPPFPLTAFVSQWAKYASSRDAPREVSTAPPTVVMCRNHAGVRAVDPVRELCGPCSLEDMGLGSPA